MEGASGRTAAPSFLLEMTPDGLVIGTHVLARPQFGSANYDFIMYMISHANDILRFDDVIEAAGLPKRGTKRLPHYLNELGFNGALKKLYWPATSGGVVWLSNPITEDRLAHYLPPEKLKNATITNLLDL